MKRTLKHLTLLISFLGLAHCGLASHIAGANIEYECLGGNQYKVLLTVFQDCLDTNVPNSYSVRIVNQDNNFTSRSLARVSVDEVSQLCQSSLPQSLCNGGLQPGYKKVVYEYTGTLEESSWGVSTELRVFFKWNYRTPSLNVDNSNDLTFYVHAIIYPFADGCHDSPTVTNQTVPYVCVGNQTSLNFGVLANGADSLHFSLSAALQPGPSQGFTPVPYQGGYTGAVPIPGITINSITGQLEFIATIQGLYTIAIEVEQFDSNGELTGVQILDVLITALACPDSPPEAVQNELVNTSGSAEFTGPLSISMCYGDDFCADYEFQSSALAANITVTSNLDQVLPGATLTVSGSNPAIATICWTANDQSSGGNVVLTANDELCPLPGITSAGFNVEVLPGVYAGPDESFCAGTTIQLGASGSDNYTWTSISGDGTEIFDCTNCPDPTFIPTQSSIYEVSGSSSGNGCNTTDQVSIEPALDYSSSVTGTGCSQDDGSIQLDILTGSDDYSVVFEGSTIPLSAASFDTTNLSTGDYDISILDNVLGCSVDITETVASAAVIPDPDITPPSVVCGLELTLDGNTDGGLITWTANGPGTISFDDNEIEDPSIIVGSAGTYWFYIEETNTTSGCTSIDSLDITFSVLPPVSAGVDSSLCALDYNMLGDATGGTWTWFDLGPGTVTYGTNANDPSSPISVSQFGSYTFLWTYEYPNGCEDPGGQVIIDFYSTPIADSPDTLTFCQLADNNLDAVPPAVGETGYWDVLSGSFTYGLEYNAIIQNTGTFGEFEAEWTVENPGCSFMDTTLLIYIAPEDADITTTTNQICGNSISLSAGNTGGSWSCSDTDLSFTNPNSNSTTATVSSPGGYTVEWTVGQGICATTDSWTMFFTDSAQVEIGTIPAEICSSDSIDVSGIVNNGLSNTWMSNGNGIFLDPSSTSTIYAPGSSDISSGTVDLTLTNTGSGICPDVSQTITVLVQGAAEVTPGVTGPSSICSDNYVQLDGTPLNTLSTGWESSGDGSFVGPADDPRYFPGFGDILAGSATLYYTGIQEFTVCDIAIDSLEITVTEASFAGIDSTLSVCVSAAAIDVLSLYGSESQTGGSLAETTSSGALTGSMFDPTTAGIGTYTFSYTVLGIAPCIDSEAIATIEVTPGANAGTGVSLELCTSSPAVNLFNELTDSPQSGGVWSETSGSPGLSGNMFDPSGAGTGTYELEYLIQIPGCQDDMSSIDIEVGVTPTAEAGLDVLNICETEELLLNGMTTSADSILWSSDGDGTYSDEDSENSQYVLGTTDISSGTTTLTFTAYGFPGCPTAVDQISLNIDESPVAGLDNSTTLCSSSSSLDLATLLSSDAQAGGTWSDVDGSGGLSGSVFDPSSVLIGEYEITYTVSPSGACPDSTAIMTIEVTSAADAGIDNGTVVCNTSTEIDLTALLSGTPQAGGVWTAVENGAGLTGSILDPSALTPAIYHYNYTLAIPGCSPNAESELTVEIISSPSVDIPWNDLNICENQAIILDSEVSNFTGLSWSSEGNGIFSQTDITNPSYVLGSEDLSAGESYLYLTANGAIQCPSTMDSVLINIQSLPTADAGPLSIDVCESLPVDLDATASSFDNVSWSTDGDGTFTDSGIEDAMYNLGTLDISTGSVTLSFTAEGLGTCGDDTDEIVIIVDPISDAGTDGTVSLCESGIAVDLIDQLLGSPDIGGAWTDLDGSGGLSGDSFDPTNSSPGSYTLQYETSNSGVCPNDLSTVEVTVTDGPDSGQDGNATICESLVDFELFSGLEGNPETGGLWSDLSGSGALNVDEFNASINGSGSFIFRYTLSEIGCADESSEVTVDVVPAPSIEIQAHPGSICSGQDIALESMTSNSSLLTWSSSGSGEFSNSSSANTVYTPSSADLISGTVSFEVEAEGATGCALAQDQISIDVIATPSSDAGMDMEVCGLSNSLNASTSLGTGTWTATSGVIFAEENQPFSQVTVPNHGSYVFTWTEDNEGCVDSDEVEFIFLDSPDTTGTTVECINTNTEYLITIGLTGGEPSSYEITGSGSLSGSTFTSSPIATGSSYSFQVSDANSCSVLEISGSFSCPSLSEAGSMDPDTLDICEDEMASALFLNDAFLDANDLQVFVLHDQAVGVGAILAESLNPEFSIQSGMNLEQTYYISSAVGDDDGTGSINLSATGTLFSNPTPVVFHGAPNAIASDESIEFCEGDTISTELELSGNAPYTLSYSFNLISAEETYSSSLGFLTFSDAGELVLTEIMDQYCNTELTQNVEFIILPSPSLSLDDTLRTCNNELLPIELEFDGIGPWNYELNINGIDQGLQISTMASQQITPSSAGSYSFYNVVDQNCVNGDTIDIGVDVITTPLANAGPDRIICDGETVLIGAEPIEGNTYSWTNGELLEFPENSQTPTILSNEGVSPMNQSFILTTTFDICTTTDEVTVTVNPVPQDYGITGVSSLCFGDSITLSVFGGASYAWASSPLITDTSSQSIQVTPLADEELSVSIINEFQCARTAIFPISVNPIPDAVLQTVVLDACPPARVILLNGTDPSTFTACSWTFPEAVIETQSCSSVELRYPEPGIYVSDLQVTNEFGCSRSVPSDSVFVSSATAEFVFYPNTPTADDSVIHVFDISEESFLQTWIFNGDSVATGLSPEISLNGLRPDFYTVCLIMTTLEGCIDTVCQTFELDNNVTVWVPNSFSPNADRTNDVFYAVVNGKEYVEEFNFRVFDRKGHVKFETSDSNKGWDGINVRDNGIMQGMYQWDVTIKVFGEPYPRQYRGYVNLLK